MSDQTTLRDAIKELRELFDEKPSGVDLFESHLDAVIAAALRAASPMIPSTRTRLQEIVEEMRSERPRYKSHDLGYVDSVSANRVDEWADEIAALIEPVATRLSVQDERKLEID